MNRSYFVVLVLALGAVMSVFYMTGVDFRAFLDIPSLAVVLVFAVLMSFASHSPREIGRSYRVAFSSRSATRAEIESARVYFDHLNRYLAYGGALGVTIGLVAILGFAGIVGDVGAVGRGLAVCLLSAVYAVVLIAVVAVPFRAAVCKRLAGDSGPT